MSQEPTYGGDNLPDDVWEYLERKFPLHDRVLRWIRSQHERCNSERVNAETGLHLFFNTALRDDILDLRRRVKETYETLSWFKINSELGLLPSTGTIKELIDAALDARLPPPTEPNKPIYYRVGPNNKGGERWIGPGSPDEGGGKWVRQKFIQVQRPEEPQLPRSPQQTAVQASPLTTPPAAVSGSVSTITTNPTS